MCGLAGRGGVCYGDMDREGARMIEGSFRKIGQGFYLFIHSVDTVSGKSVAIHAGYSH